MASYCLSKKELESFLDHIIEDSDVDDGNLKILIESCRVYEEYLSGFTYHVAQLIDRQLKNGRYTSDFIGEVFDIQDHMAFELQEFDNEFVDFLLKNKREKSLSLEEELIDIQNRISNHEYGKNYRF